MKSHRSCCHGHSIEEEFYFTPLARVQNQFLGIDLQNDSQKETELKNNFELIPTVSGRVILQSKSNSLIPYLNIGHSEEEQKAIVLSIDGGIGSVTVAMKQLGIGVGKVIHVEKNLVAKHVYRSNHDFSYGETEQNDGIKHIVGL